MAIDDMIIAFKQKQCNDFQSLEKKKRRIFFIFATIFGIIPGILAIFAGGVSAGITLLAASAFLIYVFMKYSNHLFVTVINGWNGNVFVLRTGTNEGVIANRGIDIKNPLVGGFSLNGKIVIIPKKHDKTVTVQAKLIVEDSQVEDVEMEVYKSNEVLGEMCTGMEQKNIWNSSLPIMIRKELTKGKRNHQSTSNGRNGSKTPRANSQ